MIVKVIIITRHSLLQRASPFPQLHVGSEILHVTPLSIVYNLSSKLKNQLTKVELRQKTTKHSTLLNVNKFSVFLLVHKFFFSTKKSGKSRTLLAPFLCDSAVLHVLELFAPLGGS